ncbi:Nephrocystin-1 [Chytriomyces hyalinus]|nr:Nephrocystin-1 [Chytriomyces hyalinus]
MRVAKPKQYERIVALFDYSGTTDEELDIHSGDLFALINKENKDWWYVRDERNDERVGYVPRTYVAYADDSGAPVVDSDIEDASETAESRKVTVARIRESMARASADSKRYSKRGRDAAPAAEKGRGPQLPAGCTESILSTYKQNNDKVLSKTLCPVVNPTGTAFLNLAMDPATKQLKSCPVQCTLGFSIIEAKNIIPLVADGRVLGRQVRMALVNNLDVFSNVHSVPAIYSSEVPNQWKFSAKASLLFPKDDENTCFLRSNDVDIQLCLMFELCALLEMSDTKDRTDIIEVSVGWGMLPLFTSDGTAIENKSYDIRLYSGSPFTKEGFSKDYKEKKGFLMTLIQGNKHPRLNIKVWKLGKSVLDDINQLPESICSFLSAVPVMAKYRQIMSDTLLRDKSFGPRIDPALSMFPTICNQSDLLHLLCLVWERKTQQIKHKHSKNQKIQTLLQKKFRECVLLLWPILHMHEFPTYVEGHEKICHARIAFANDIQELGMLELLGKNREQYGIAPFDMAELACNFP